MKVLVACEYSATVRDAFRAKGHNAWSCDILPCDKGPDFHIQGDVLGILGQGWDLMIAHPPCTHLAVSGGRHFKKKKEDGRQQEGIDFFMALGNCQIPKYCIENPVSIMATVWRKPDQYIHPFEFGDPVSKKTGLWLKGLPKLTPTNVVECEMITNSKGKTYCKWWYETCSISLPQRGKARSKTFQGIANAMADQWG